MDDVGGVEHYNAATSECTPHTRLLQYSHSLVISSPPVVFLVSLLGSCPID